MRVFQNHAELNAATALPTTDGKAYRFLASFGPAGFLCHQCRKTVQFPLTGGGTGYALTNPENHMICYPCADENDRAALLDRSKPFGAYLSSDGRYVTTWTGGKLGEVLQETASPSGFGGSYITRIRMRDVHGNLWHGRGGGRSMCLTLRAMKG